MEKELAKTIGAAARKARVALGLTQEEAAERIEISLVFYARIERGETLPSTPTLAAISRALGVSADALLRGTTTNNRGTRLLDHTAPASDDLPPTPELRRLVRRLRRAKPSTVRLLCQLAAHFVRK